MGGGCPPLRDQRGGGPTTCPYVWTGAPAPGRPWRHIPIIGFILQPSVIPSSDTVAVEAINTHFLCCVDKVEVCRGRGQRSRWRASDAPRHATHPPGDAQSRRLGVSAQASNPPPQLGVRPAMSQWGRCSLTLIANREWVGLGADTRTRARGPSMGFGVGKFLGNALRRSDFWGFGTGLGWGSPPPGPKRRLLQCRRC